MKYNVLYSQVQIPAATVSFGGSGLAGLSPVERVGAPTSGRTSEGNFESLISVPTIKSYRSGVDDTSLGEVRALCYHDRRGSKVWLHFIKTIL